MATREFGVRDLRNDTGAVIDAVNSGDTVYVTKRGVRVAELRPVQPRRRIDVLMEKAAEISRGDSGALDELMDAKWADIDAQHDEDQHGWG